MENINLFTIGDRHTTTILSAIPAPRVIIGNRPTTFHRHRQPPVSVIGINQPLALAIGIDQSPSLDLATSCYFAIDINPYRQFL